MWISQIPDIRFWAICIIQQPDIRCNPIFFKDVIQLIVNVIVQVVLDTEDWSTEIVQDIPQQMNGSDCGMFACKFAEYISRGAKITFTQDVSLNYR